MASVRVPSHQGRADMMLNQNPTNYDAQVEQLAFSPAHLVPGIEPFLDKMLQVGGGIRGVVGLQSTWNNMEILITLKNPLETLSI